MVAVALTNPIMAVNFVAATFYECNYYYVSIWFMG